MTQSKIFIIGITQNSKQDIDEMTRDILPYIDGLIFVDSQSNDGTKELLEERKGAGEIISLPWMDNHSWSMNACLNSNKMQPGNWFIILDSSERLNIGFALYLRKMVKELEIRNINTVYHHSKAAIIKYNPNLFFAGSPHWGLHGVIDYKIRLEDTFPDPNHCIYSTRTRRPRDHFINHFTKYYLRKISNHLMLGRENNVNEYIVHEQIRNKFRSYCLDELSINPLTVESLLNYFQNNKLNYRMKWFLNFERILNDFYCYRILSHQLDDILERHKTGTSFEIKS